MAFMAFILIISLGELASVCVVLFFRQFDPFIQGIFLSFHYEDLSIWLDDAILKMLNSWFFRN